MMKVNRPNSGGNRLVKFNRNTRLCGPVYYVSLSQVIFYFITSLQHALCLLIDFFFSISRYRITVFMIRYVICIRANCKAF